MDEYELWHDPGGEKIEKIATGTRAEMEQAYFEKEGTDPSGDYFIENANTGDQYAWNQHRYPPGWDLC